MALPAWFEVATAFGVWLRSLAVNVRLQHQRANRPISSRTEAETAFVQLDSRVAAALLTIPFLAQK